MFYINEFYQKIRNYARKLKDFNKIQGLIWPLKSAHKTSPLFRHSRQIWHLPPLLWVHFQPLPVLGTKGMHWLLLQTMSTTLLMWRPSGPTSTPSWTDLSPDPMSESELTPCLRRSGLVWIRLSRLGCVSWLAGYLQVLWQSLFKGRTVWFKWVFSDICSDWP